MAGRPEPEDLFDFPNDEKKKQRTKAKSLDPQAGDTVAQLAGKWKRRIGSLGAEGLKGKYRKMFEDDSDNA